MNAVVGPRGSIERLVEHHTGLDAVARDRRVDADDLLRRDRCSLLRHGLRLCRRGRLVLLLRRKTVCLPYRNGNDAAQALVGGVVDFGQQGIDVIVRQLNGVAIHRVRVRALAADENLINIARVCVQMLLHTAPRRLL